eukprot:CAMPEP_0196579790 /NCGR_PEP_ID=MMETSP1081-20130531/24747_1 /TAXON_ID=36882 /ORGANISM="Pyramimonas amylifera, Strain CCMP720" /LENGTH=193 /DNA_ID=CAMNT_0041899475 /DNA_START=274 /DNA_END=855 /DNA_ORIENTATION=+
MLEGYIQILEKAYKDEYLATELQEKMRTDTEFAAGMKTAMEDERYRDRLTAAIESSDFMQKAIEDSPQIKRMKEETENNPLLQPFQDEKVLEQLEALQGDPQKMSMMMQQSETKLKSVAGDLVLGVKEYYEDFQPNADDLMAKFEEISVNGYKAFMKIGSEDKQVQNAIINALMDAMEEDRAQQEGDKLENIE